MSDAPLVAEWKDEARRKGRARGKIDALLHVLRRKHFPFPFDVEEGILDNGDLAQVDRWLVAAAKTDTLEPFRLNADSRWPLPWWAADPTTVESDLVREWKAEAWAEGFPEGYVEGVFVFLRARFPDLPKDLADSILACRDEKEAQSWIRPAVSAETLDQFRQQTSL